MDRQASDHSKATRLKEKQLSEKTAMNESQSADLKKSQDYDIEGIDSRNSAAGPTHPLRNYSRADHYVRTPALRVI